MTILASLIAPMQECARAFAKRRIRAVDDSGRVDMNARIVPMELRGNGVPSCQQRGKLLFGHVQKSSALDEPVPTIVRCHVHGYPCSHNDA
jgi:hypothetical protein